MNTNFYKLFNLSLAKQKGTLTDEMVKENYLNKRRQYFQMLKKCADKKEKHSIPELKEILDDDYLKLLDEAYESIKTENDRKKYDEFIANSEKEAKNQVLNTKKHSDNNLVNQENKGIEKQVNTTNASINTSENTKKDISFIPIYHGKYGKLPPKKNIHSNITKVSKNDHNSKTKNDDHNDDLDII